MVRRTGLPFFFASSAVGSPTGRVADCPSEAEAETVEVFRSLTSREASSEEFLTMPSLVSTIPPYWLALLGTAPASGISVLRVWV